MAQNKREEAKQQQELHIPDLVADLLNPISKDSPTGKEVTVDEEYFKLDLEIGKVSPDYKVCIELASEILKEKSKDLRVASWLCFAWYRNENIVGLKNGLILLLELLKNYGNKQFPENPIHQIKALQFLNSGRFVKLFEREIVNKENAQLILETDKIFQQFTYESKNQFPDNTPEFNNISKVLTDHVATAKQFLVKTPSKDIPKAEDEAGKKPTEEIIKETKTEKKILTTNISEKRLVPEVAISARDVDVTSEKNATLAIRNALKFFFQKDREDINKYEAYLFGLSRSLIWGKLVMPPEENSATQVSAPDSAIQNTLKEWFANRNWDKLIPAIELNLLDEDSGFKYWLTVQRYLTTALGQKSGHANRAAEEVKFHLIKLITYFPNLTKLRFENNMPFADDDTLKWIEEEVRTSLGDGKNEDLLLPPIIGEDYEPINEEYQKACAELPKNFEKNMKNMQQEISGETRRKGRFLRALNLANFCIQAKQYNLAKVHLSSLLEKIQAYQLAEWESALCVAVWESTYLVNIKLLDSQKDLERKSFLERQQNDLFSKIGNFDSVLALKLANRYSKKGG